MKISPLVSLAVLLGFTAVAENHVIQQEARQFSVKEVTIKPGDKLVFTNCDSVTHSIFSTSKENPFPVKMQKPGQSSTVQFKNEGDTEVRCAIHPKMKIMVHVKK